MNSKDEERELRALQAITYPYVEREPERATFAPGLVISELTMAAVQAEALRAHIKHKERSMLRPKPNTLRLSILVEEVGECARELNDAKGTIDKDKLEMELIQVAAMAASWIEALNDEANPNRLSVGDE